MTRVWAWEEHELSEGYSCIVYDEHGQAVADHLSREDAAMVCAAPTLLEALIKTRQLVADCAPSGYTDKDAVLALYENNAALCAAISLAKGDAA